MHRVQVAVWSAPQEKHIVLQRVRVHWFSSHNLAKLEILVSNRTKIRGYLWLLDWNTRMYRRSREIYSFQMFKNIEYIHNHQLILNKYESVKIIVILGVTEAEPRNLDIPDRQDQAYCTN
jgi:hypothetical protein